MGVLVALYRENKLFVCIGLVLVIGSAIANVSVINFINQAISSEGQFIREHTISILLVLLTAFVLGVGSQMLMTQLGYRVIYQLRGTLLQQVLNTEYEHIQALGRNRIYAAISKDIRSLQEGFIVLPFFIYAMTMTLGGLIYLFTLHLGLASFALVSLVLGTLLARYLTSRFHHLIRQDRDLEDDLFKGYETILDGHKELVLNEQRGKSLLRDIMMGPAKKSMHVRTLADRYIVVNMHFMTTLILLQIVLVFWLVFAFELGGLAMATSFALTLMFIRQPVNMAMNHLGPMFIAQVSLRKIQSLQLGTEEAAEVGEALEWKELTLDQVVYRYPNDHSSFTLGPLSLTINQGDLIFLVGHNGAGKTTLIRMILGLIKPSSGQLLLDGTPLNLDNLREYRKGYSAVLADFHLFDHVDDETIEQKNLIHHWLEQLGLNDKISFSNGSFSSTDLSTGQRKRLAMVSAIAENRRVMILDEWAADQDPVFREKFYRELLPALKSIGYTLFVVSHDDRFFDIADRVIHLDGGHLHETDAVKPNVSSLVDALD